MHELCEHVATRQSSLFELLQGDCGLVGVLGLKRAQPVELQLFFLCARARQLHLIHGFIGVAKESNR